MVRIRIRRRTIMVNGSEGLGVSSSSSTKADDGAIGKQKKPEIGSFRELLFRKNKNLVASHESSSPVQSPMPLSKSAIMQKRNKCLETMNTNRTGSGSHPRRVHYCF